MTTAAVPSTDPVDFLLNVETFDAAINSTNPTLVDRLGATRSTLNGAIESIKSFTDRGAWAAVTVYAGKDLASNSGTWYVCVVPHTSSAAFATDVASKWRVYQGITVPDLSSSDASALMGHIDLASDSVAVTAQARLRELSANTPAATMPNLGSVTNRNITILGDSISHGAFALNTFMHGWARVFERMVNAELNASSYGFVNFLSLGSGGTLTTDIHSVTFAGTAWGSVDSATDAGAANYPPGMAMRPGDGTSTITVVVPSFQSRVTIYYGTRPGSLPFTVEMNGVLVATIVTDAADGYSSQTVTLTDNGYGSATVGIKATAGAYANQPDIIGLGYISAVIEPVVNNFSTSGRRLRHIGQALITTLMQESSTVILALGINDYGSADTDPTYWADFQIRIGWIKDAAKLYGVKLIVPDFLWGALPSSRTRQALRQLAADTRGIYIDLPGEIFKNRESMTEAQRYTYLVSTLAMWTDGSHPNKYGHQWIAETISKRMGLSVTSKNEALRFHDWWMPLALKVATGAYNYYQGDLTSKYKRNGSELLVRFFIRKAATGAFPSGDHVLQDAWPTKSELGILQGADKIGVIRSDTGAVNSTLSIAASGAITLKVLNAWLNYQQVDFSLTAG